MAGTPAVRPRDHLNSCHCKAVAESTVAIPAPEHRNGTGANRRDRRLVEFCWEKPPRGRNVGLDSTGLKGTSPEFPILKFGCSLK